MKAALRSQKLTCAPKEPRSTLLQFKGVRASTATGRLTRDTSGGGRVEGVLSAKRLRLCSWAWNQESCVISRDLGAKGPLGTRGCTLRLPERGDRFSTAG
jgi:hypothetical protein